MKKLDISFPRNYKNQFGNESHAIIIIELLRKFPKLEDIQLRISFNDEAITMLRNKVKEIKNITNSLFLNY